MIFKPNLNYICFNLIYYIALRTLVKILQWLNCRNERINKQRFATRSKFYDGSRFWQRNRSISDKTLGVFRVSLKIEKNVANCYYSEEFSDPSHILIRRISSQSIRNFCFLDIHRICWKIGKKNCLIWWITGLKVLPAISTIS